ncbi:MAG: homoserine dehydrogenase, partial [Gemmataceae bacterium]
MKPFRIGLLGFGTVGSAVAKMLLENPDRLADRCGRPMELAKILVKDPSKPRSLVVPPGLVTTDLKTILDDPEIDLIVELMGGCDSALRAIEGAFGAGKDVV